MIMIIPCSILLLKENGPANNRVVAPHLSQDVGLGEGVRGEDGGVVRLGVG